MKTISRCKWCRRVEKIERVVHPHKLGFNMSQYIMTCPRCGINQSYCRINVEEFIERYNNLVDLYDEVTKAPDGSIEITAIGD